MRGYKHYLGALEEAIRHCPADLVTELGRLEYMANDARSKIAALKVAVDADTNATWDAIRNVGGMSCVEVSIRPDRQLGTVGS